MKIDKFRVYDLEESIIASGLPMKAEYSTYDFAESCYQLHIKRLAGELDESNPFQRMWKLANNPVGSGHCNALSGVLVSANVTATVKWWEQFQRYHFKQIVSSMSTMHRLREMALQGTIQFNDCTNPDMVKAFMRLAKDESVTDEELAYSCPMGLELTARITTNYLQLKTMYNQRRNHKLTEWRDFCGWIEKLPFAAEFITGKKELEK